MFAHHAEKNLANNGFAAAVMDYGPSARDEQIKNAKSDDDGDDGDSDGEVKDGVYEEGTAYGVTKVYLSERCSATGVPHLFFDTHILRKTLWLIALIFCLYRMIVESIAAFEDYLSFPVSVSISVVDQKDFDFPAVTICNLNMLSYNKIDILKPAALHNLVEVENKYMREIRGNAGVGKADNFSGICAIGYPLFEKPANSSKYWRPERNERIWDVYMNKTGEEGSGDLTYPYYNPCDLINPPNCSNASSTSGTDLRCSRKKAAASTTSTANTVTTALGRKKRAVEMAEHLQELHLALQESPDLKGIYQQTVQNALEKILAEPHVRLKRQFPSVTSVVSTGTNALNTATNTVVNTANTATNTIASTVNATTNTIASTVNATTNTIASTVNATTNTITSAVNATTNTITSAVNATTNTIASAVNATTNTIASAVNATSNTIASAVNATTNTITSAVNATTNTLTGTLNDTLSSATSLLDNTVSAAVSVIDTAVNTAQATINNTVSSATGALNSTIDAATNTLNTAINSAMSTVNNTVNSAISAVSSAVNEATSLVHNTVSSATTLVNNTVSAATSGINNTVNTATNTITNTVNTAMSTVNKTLDAATSLVNNTVNTATSALNNTVNAATSTINNTVDAATAAVKNTVNEAMSLANGTLSSATKLANELLVAAQVAANATVMAATKAASETLAAATKIANETIIAAQNQSSGVVTSLAGTTSALTNVGKAIITTATGPIADVIMSVASITNLTEIASILTNSLTTITDDGLLRKILTVPDCLSMLKALNFPILTDSLMDLLSFVVDDYVNLGGLLNFHLRPGAKEIFNCSENGSYKLMVNAFTEFTKDQCPTAEVPCVDFILNTNFSSSGNSTELKKCVKVTQLCDGYRDCADGSDEGLLCNHSRTICPRINDTRNGQLGHFVCNRTGSCINNLLVCDCTKDCPDNWDESNCSNSTAAVSNVTVQAGASSSPSVAALKMAARLTLGGGFNVPTVFDPPPPPAPAPNPATYVPPTTNTFGSCYAKKASASAAAGPNTPAYMQTEDNSRFYGLDPYDIEAIIKRSETGDLSDVQQVVTPTPDYLEFFGTRAEDFIMSCSIDGKLCSYKDFYKWQSHSYGNCFTFNSPFLRYQDQNNTNGTSDDYQVYHTFRYGAQNGLKLVLNAETEQYLSSFTPDIGVRVVVHPNNMIPFPEDTGLNIPPGYTTSIGIKKKTVQRASYPYGECHPADWDFNGDYSQMACIKACIETQVRETCTCMSLISPLFDDHNSTFAVNKPYTGLPRCSPTNETQDECYYGVWESYKNGSMVCDCNPACNEDSFAQTISMSEQNKRFAYILARMKRFFTAEEFCQEDPNKMSTVRLSVYVESTAQEIIQESPQYSTQDLIANLGGIWGFYLGFSAVTVLELLEYITYLFGYAGDKGACGRNNGRVASSATIRPTPASGPQQKPKQEILALQPLPNNNKRPPALKPPANIPSYEIKSPSIDPTLRRPVYVPPPGVAADRLSLESEVRDDYSRSSIGSSSSRVCGAKNKSTNSPKKAVRKVHEDDAAMPNGVTENEDGGKPEPKSNGSLQEPSGRNHNRAHSPGAFLNQPEFDPFDF